MKLDEQTLTKIKVAVIESALALGLAAGVFFTGRYVVRRLKRKRSQNRSLDEGDPSSWALQLKMAFENDNYFGWGTDVEAVKRVFREVPSKSMYAKIQKRYEDLYSSNLNADLKSELDSQEMNEVMAIYNSKKA